MKSNLLYGIAWFVGVLLVVATTATMFSWSAVFLEFLFWLFVTMAILSWLGLTTRWG